MTDGVDRPAAGRRSPSGGRAVAAEVRVLALRGVPELEQGDDLGLLLHRAAAAAGGLRDADVVVVAQKAVSKVEGRVVALGDVEPSERAIELAGPDGNPRHLEWILRESRSIVRSRPPLVIAETRHGFVCANAGVDLSNAPGEGVAVLLPEDPDASARRLRAGLVSAGAGPLGVIVSDTFGRPWREGLVDVAIGCAGIAPLSDWRGRTDLVGRTLEVTNMAVVDQLAAAAGLLMGKDAGVPAVWIEGVRVEGDGPIAPLLRDGKLDLFR